MHDVGYQQLSRGSPFFSLISFFSRISQKTLLHTDYHLNILILPTKMKDYSAVSNRVPEEKVEDEIKDAKKKEPTLPPVSLGTLVNFLLTFFLFVGHVLFIIVFPCSSASQMGSIFS